MKRILITGSRDWTNVSMVHRALRQAWIELGGEDDVVLVHGACPTGADKIASDMWAQSGLTVEPHPANWDRYKKAAGPRRNAEMVALGADICLAFQRGNSRGTANTIHLAESTRIPVRVFKEP